MNIKRFYNMNFILTFALLQYFVDCQRINDYRSRQTNDFIQHEMGQTPPPGKRDFVGANWSQNIQSTGKRDYVAQFPALPTPTTTSRSTTKSLEVNIKPTSNPSTGKRDYVNPQFPSLKPHQSNSEYQGKVKDLVSFFDSKPTDSRTPQNVPSYSNILSGGTNKPMSTQVSKNVQITTPITPQKPNDNSWSFSSGLAGFNKQNAGTTTTKQAANTPDNKPTSSTTGHTTQRPNSTPILPSAILNNKNNQNSNSNSLTDAELQTLSEELLRKDTNNAAKYITINYQDKTTSFSKEDKAPQPLLILSPEVWNIPTIQKFVPLLDNYERDTLVNEHVTPQERNEENAFMDAVMTTTVVRHLMNILKNKGFVTPDPRQQRDFLKQLWFNLYSRGKGKISSSGFEHVFVSELRQGEVLGLHNWIYFSKEEAANRVNYLGYLKYSQLGDKGVVMKLHFNQQGLDKPVDTMFIGTSPELEMALYTLCFVTRPDTDCKLKLGNKDVTIITHTFRYRSKNMIGSAYPQI